MTFGSLFAGIGGLDLGLGRVGMTCLWQVEIDEFCRKVLAKHWPDVERFGDVRECGKHNLAPVDLVCGGFPCQPVSYGGKRQGESDERWLWPEFARVVCELRPRWVLAENVPGLLSVDAGRVFGGILRDLAALGYDAEWDCVSAAAVGAPHIRDRVFILAGRVRDSTRCRCGSALANARRDGFGKFQQSAPAEQDSADAGTRCETMADTDSRRLEERSQCDCEPALDSSDGDSSGQYAHRCRDDVSHDDRAGCSNIQRQCATTGTHRRSFFRADNRDTASEWRTEPDVGRVADGVPARVDRLRSLGNAVVPQVAELIGRMIVTADGQEASQATQE